uniref:Interferon a3-like n=1 Tax=Oreochromis niloticus TaxID=8128 RepID=A0A669BDY9_ORENI
MCGFLFFDYSDIHLEVLNKYSHSDLFFFFFFFFFLFFFFFFSQDEDKLAFVVQILKEVFDLFEKNRSSAPWEENTVENFLNIVNKQAEKLHSCVGSHSNTTQLTHFKGLSNETLKDNGYSAEAWEEIRNITQAHLRQCEFLVETLETAH